MYLTRAGFITKGKPVQPVAIRHPFIHFDPCWVNGINLPLLMWRSLCQFSNYLQVTTNCTNLFCRSTTSGALGLNDDVF